MTIDGGKLLFLYVDGEPVIACDEVKLTLPEIEAMNADIIRTCQEYTFESSGRWELPKPTFEQEWNYNWWMARVYPRKKKKAYRKWLKSLIAW